MKGAYIMKKIIALIITGVLVCTTAGVSFAAQPDNSSEGKGIVAGVLDLISGLADSSGEAGAGQEEAGSKNILSDLLSGLTGSASGSADNAEEASGLQGLSDMLSGLGDSSGENGEGFKADDVVNSIEGFLSGLGNSGSETSEEAEVPEEEPALDANVAGVAAGEDEGDVPAIFWEDAEAEVIEEGLEGEFVQFDEVGMEMWVPSYLNLVEVPEGTEGAETFIAFFAPEDESSYASVQYVPSDITLDDYRELLDSLGDQIEDLAPYYINGQPFLVYFISAGERMCMSTVVEGKGLLEFAFAPLSDEYMSGYSEIMGVSIRPVE